MNTREALALLQNDSWLANMNDQKLPIFQRLCSVGPAQFLRPIPFFLPPDLPERPKIKNIIVANRGCITDNRNGKNVIHLTDAQPQPSPDPKGPTTLSSSFVIESARHERLLDTADFLVSGSKPFLPSPESEKKEKHSPKKKGRVKGEAKRRTVDSHPSTQPPHPRTQPQPQPPSAPSPQTKMQKQKPKPKMTLPSPPVTRQRRVANSSNQINPSDVPITGDTIRVNHGSHSTDSQHTHEIHIPKNANTSDGERNPVHDHEHTQNVSREDQNNSDDDGNVESNDADCGGNGGANGDGDNNNDINDDNDDNDEADGGDNGDNVNDTNDTNNANEEAPEEAGDNHDGGDQGSEEKDDDNVKEVSSSSAPSEDEPDDNVNEQQNAKHEEKKQASDASPNHRAKKKNPSKNSSPADADGRPRSNTRRKRKSGKAKRAAVQIADGDVDPEASDVDKGDDRPMKDERKSLKRRRQSSHGRKAQRGKRSRLNDSRPLHHGLEDDKQAESSDEEINPEKADSDIAATDQFHLRRKPRNRAPIAMPTNVFNRHEHPRSSRVGATHQMKRMRRGGPSKSVRVKQEVHEEMNEIEASPVRRSALKKAGKSRIKRKRHLDEQNGTLLHKVQGDSEHSDDAYDADNADEEAEAGPGPPPKNRKRSKKADKKKSRRVIEKTIFKIPPRSQRSEAMQELVTWVRKLAKMFDVGQRDAFIALREADGRWAEAKALLNK